MRIWVMHPLNSGTYHYITDIYVWGLHYVFCRWNRVVHYMFA